MARVATLRARLREIRRKYAHVNSFRYFYNNKRELKARLNRVKIWFLINDASIGYSIFPMEFKRAIPMSIEQWRRLFTKPVTAGERTYDPLFQIFVLKVLPVINQRNGTEWKFKSLIGWAGFNDIRPSKHAAKRAARNTTTKKRNANARNSNRR